MTISHGDMVLALLKPGEDIVASLTTDGAHLWHCATGVAGECGELLLAVLDAEHGEHGCPSPIDRDNVIEELGDLEFYLQGFRTVTGITREQADSLAIAIPDVADLHIAICYLNAAGANLLDLTKKTVVYNKPLENLSAVRWLGAIEAGTRNIRALIGVSREDVIAANIDKLVGPAGRFRDLVYSDKAAIERADKEPGQ